MKRKTTTTIITPRSVYNIIIYLTEIRAFFIHMYIYVSYVYIYAYNVYRIIIIIVHSRTHARNVYTSAAVAAAVENNGIVGAFET